MNSRSVSPAAASAVCVCLDERNGRDWAGRLYTRYQEEPVPFRNMGELLAELENFYNWLNYPEPSTVDRSFRGQKAQEKQARRPKIKEERVVLVSAEDMGKKHGDQATFIVRIQYRQNATWQGRVTWTETNKTLPFRSALELMKLIDSTNDAQSANWEETDQ